MATTIDQKVVEMKFDNSQFQKNVKSTVISISDLKQKLEFKNSTKGIENVNAAVKKTDFSPMAKALDSISAKFSALDVVAATVVANITNSITNSAKQMLSAVTIDPIISGFSEYETKIGAIQTIMSNTSAAGTSMDEIIDTIDKLNVYADKTIYNFAEMTRNIGTFTAAGVGLQDSADAIQGIANLAAASGSNSQQASTAMYQLSQALASGTVKLMDWNSVVNAGMGGQLFQEALKETAREHDIAVDQMIKNNGSFRDSLQDGWITADVLNETLKKFTVEGAKAYAKSMIETGQYTEEQAAALIAEAQAMEDAATKVKTFTQLVDTLKESLQSGWGKTWELLIGNFDEAKELFTEVSDVLGGMINQSSDIRNSLIIDGFGSGWDSWLNQGIADQNAYIESIKSVAKNQGIAIDEMVEEHGSFAATLKEGWMTSDILWQSLNDLTWQTNQYTDEQLEAIGMTKDQVKALNDLYDSVTLGGKSMDTFIDSMTAPTGRENIIQALWNSFDALLSVLGPIKEAFEEIFPAPTAAQLKEFTVQLEAFTRTLALSEENMNRLKRSFSGLFAIFDVLLYTVTEVAGFFLGELYTGITATDDGVLSITANIGDTLKAFRDWYKEANVVGAVLKTISNSVSFVVNSIRYLINEFMELPIVTEAITNVQINFENMHDSISKKASAISKIISKFIQSIAEMDTITLDNIPDVFANIGETVHKILETLNLDSLFAGIQSQATGPLQVIADTISNAFTAVTNVLRNFVTWVQESIGFAEALVIVMSGSMIGILGVVTKALVIVKSVTGSIGDLVGSLTGIMDGVASVLKAHAFKTGAQGVLMLAASLAILAGSLLVLSMIPAEDLKNVTITLGLLAVGLAALVGLMKIIGSTGAISFASTILGMSIALVMLVDVFIKLDNAVFNNIQQSVGILLGISAAMIAFATLISIINASIKPQSITAAILSSLTMISFVFSLKTLVDILVDIDNSQFQDLPKMATILGALMLGLVTVMHFSKGVSVGAAVTLIAFVIALKSFLDILENIQETNFHDIEKVLLFTIPIFSTFIILMKTTSKAGAYAISAGIFLIAVVVALNMLTNVIMKIREINVADIDHAVQLFIRLNYMFVILTAVSKYAGKNAAKAGALLLSSALSMLVLVGAIAILTELDPAGVELATQTITIIMGMMALLVASSYLAGSATKTIIALGVIIAGLSVSLALLTILDPVKLQNASLCIAAIMVAFGLLIASTKLATNAIKPALQMTLVVGLLGGIIIGLSLLPSGDVLPIAVAMSMLIVALAGSVTLLSKMSPMLNRSIGTLALLGLIAGGLGAIFAVISNIVNPTTLLPLIGGITAMLAALIGAMALMSLIGPVAWTSIGILAVLTLVVGGIGVLIAYMSTMINPDTVLPITFGLTAVLIGLSAVLVALAYVGTLGPAAFTGIGALVTLIAALVIVIGGLGALVTYVPMIEQFLNTGIPIMMKLGEGLGSFIGGFLEATLSGLHSGLPDLANDLVDFMDNLQPFIDKVTGMDAISFDAIGSLVGAILALTAANVLEQITAFFVGDTDFDAFATKLVSLANGLVEFSDVVKDNIDSTAVEAAANAGMMLTDLANSVPNSGGKLGEWLGENELDDFAEKLVPFGEAMVAYSEVVSGNIDEEGVAASARAGAMLTDLANNVPNSGGMLAELMGDNDIATFGQSLISFARSMVWYSFIAKGIDEAAVQKSADIGTIMTTFADSIPTSGGLIDFVTGGDNIADFGADLVDFAESMVSYSEEVSGLDSDAVTKSVEIGDALVALASAIPEGGWGDVSLKDFGKDVEDFGAELYDFYKDIEDLDAEQTGAVVDIIDMIISVAQNATGLDVSGLTSLSTSLSTLASNGIDGFVDTFTAADTTIATTVSNFVTNTLTIFTNKEDEFGEVGTGLMQELTESFVTGFHELISIVGSRMTSAIATVNAIVWVESSTIGKNLIDGIVRGLQNNTGLLTQASRNVINSAVTAMRKEGDINSPSGVTEDKVGYELDRGVAAGLTNNMGIVANAGANVVKTVTTTMSSQSGSFFSDVGNTISNGLATGIEKATPYVQSAGDSLMNTFSGVMGTDVTAMMNSLGIDAGIAYSDAYAEGITYGMVEVSDETKKAADEIVMETSEAGKAAFEHSKKWIDDQIKYQNMGAREQIEAWERVKARYDVMSDEYAEAETNLLDLRKQAIDDWYSHMDDKQSEIEELQNEYDDALLERQQKYAEFDLFEEVADVERQNGRELIKNLEDQTKAIEKFYANIATLNEMGINAEVVEELREKGISAQGEVSALLNISEKDIERLNAAYLEQQTLINNMALADTEEQRVSTEQQIADILTNITSIYETEAPKAGLELTAGLIEGINMGNSAVIEAAINTAKDSVKAMSEALGVEYIETPIKTDSEDSSPITENFVTALSELLTFINDDVKIFEAGGVITKRIADGMNAATPEVSTATESVVQSSINKANASKNDFAQTGINLVEGFVAGIRSMIEEAARAAAEMARAAWEAANAELGVNSPSKKLYETGRWTGVGFVNSLMDAVSGVYKAGAIMAQAAVDGVTQTVDTLTKMSDPTIEITPIIRPVIDSSMSRNQTSGIKVANANMQATSIATAVQERKNPTTDSTAKTETINNNYNFTQNNNSPKALNRLEIYRQTRNQFSALKGATQ